MRMIDINGELTTQRSHQRMRRLRHRRLRHRRLRMPHHAVGTDENPRRQPRRSPHGHYIPEPRQPASAAEYHDTPALAICEKTEDEPGYFRCADSQLMVCVADEQFTARPVDIEAEYTPYPYM